MLSVWQSRTRPADPEKALANKVLPFLQEPISAQLQGSTPHVTDHLDFFPCEAALLVEWHIAV